jgi:hypothetical protein
VALIVSERSRQGGQAAPKDATAAPIASDKVARDDGGIDWQAIGAQPDVELAAVATTAADDDIPF